MKIVSWNINSLRLRLPLLQKFVDIAKPDVVCLQETKVANEFFPLQAVKDLGFDYVEFDGEKSYNGVAILSKFPLSNVQKIDVLDYGQKRHISAKIEVFDKKIEIHNFYIPAGGDEADVKINAKFDHKLKFLDWMEEYFYGCRIKSGMTVEGSTVEGGTVEDSTVEGSDDGCMINEKLRLISGMTEQKFGVDKSAYEEKCEGGLQRRRKMHKNIFQASSSEPTEKIPSEVAFIILGDFNIAPLENDVWSHKQLLKVVSHTPIEVEKLTKIQKSLNFIDTHRFFVDKNEKLYSWWSYRGREPLKSDKGRRLDHIWATPNLKTNIKEMKVFQDFRIEKSPSDHVPILTEFKF